MTEVSVSRDGVEDDEPPSSDSIQTIVETTLKTARFQGPCEISILLTNDGKIRELNSQYRDIDKATDVLSFAFEEDDSVQLPPDAPRVLGDVVLSLEKIRVQAEEHSKTYPQEFSWALCHGVLHLIGFDHQTDEQESKMRKLETQTLEHLDEGFFDW